MILHENKRIEHVNDYINNYNNYIKKNNVWDFLAFINKNEIISWGCPIYWTLLPDRKNSKIYKNYISAPELGLYDIDLYFDDLTKPPDYIAYKKLVKETYIKYISDIFYGCLPDDFELNPMDVYDVEVQIISAYGCTQLKENEDLVIDTTYIYIYRQYLSNQKSTISLSIENLESGSCSMYDRSNYIGWGYCNGIYYEGVRKDQPNSPYSIYSPFNGVDYTK